MNIIKADLSRDLDYVELHAISDAHVGEKKSDINLLRKRIDYIKNNPNAYCILNGDLIDNAIIGSKAEASVYEQKLSTSEQRKKVSEILKPIKNKILCIQTGNHERRTKKETGEDPTELIAEKLGIEEKYSRTSTLLFLRFGNIRNGYRQRCYAIYCIHGISSGKTVGAKANALKKLTDIVNADIFIHSHTHYPIIFPDEYFQVDYHNNTVNSKTVMLVNTGTTLREAEYAEIIGCKPSMLANPKIILYAQERKIEATISV